MELKRVVNILRYPHQIKLVEVFMLGGLFLFADIILTVWLTHRFHPFLILGLLFLTAFCSLTRPSAPVSAPFSWSRRASSPSPSGFSAFRKTSAAFWAPPSAAFSTSTLKNCTIICGCMRSRCENLQKIFYNIDCLGYSLLESDGRRPS